MPYDHDCHGDIETGDPTNNYYCFKTFNLKNLLILHKPISKKNTKSKSALATSRSKLIDQ